MDKVLYFVGGMFLAAAMFVADKFPLMAAVDLAMSVVFVLGARQEGRYQ